MNKKCDLKTDKLDIIIPIGLEDDTNTENIIKSIIALHEKTGFYKFALSGPSKGWRTVGYPPREHFLQIADKILLFKKALRDYNIQSAWWHTLTLKTGPAPYRRIVNINGQPSRFSSCPLDPDFRERFASDVALVAERARPSMIIYEDDYGINCHNGYACFCDLHLAAFAKRTGKYYPIEELPEIFSGHTIEALSLRRTWAELTKDSLVGLAAHVRKIVDKSTPDIPMGSMQPGCADADGNSTEAVAIAFAGKRHRPFVRLYGTSYGSDDAPSLPENIFHALYSKQHLPKKFIVYHESDTYPHSRFFMSAGKMKSLMAAAYSYAFDGSIFQARQHLDAPNEEKGYYEMFAREEKRFNAINKIARNCAINGCGMLYDPFWGGDGARHGAGWLKTFAHFGIPYTTKETKVNVLSGTLPNALSNKKIKELLKKGLLLDGEAAKLLCDRGFSNDIGVTVKSPVNKPDKLKDIEGREKIRNNFVLADNGRLMNWCFTYSPYGNGELFSMVPSCPTCEVITDLLDFKGKNLGPGMTRYENQNGGRVVVMAMTTKGNMSSSLFNYRRQRLLQNLLVWAGAEDIVYVKERAKTFCILNQPLKKFRNQFRGVLTLINLCSDTFESVELSLPEKWRGTSRVKYLDIDGRWKKIHYKDTAEGMEIFHPLPIYEPLYLLFQKYSNS